MENKIDFMEQLKTITPYDEVYLQRYLNFITTTNEPDKKLYGEKHHILPKSLFPKYIKEEGNLKRISAKDHFIAHYLLYKAYPKNIKMTFSFNLMFNRSKQKIDEKFLLGEVAVAYENAKNKINSHLITIMTGRKQSAETIAKRVAKTTGQKRSPSQLITISKSRVGIKYNLSTEARKAMSIRSSILHKGKRKTLQMRQRLSASTMGVKKSQAHCDSMSKARIGFKLYINETGKIILLKSTDERTKLYKIYAVGKNKISAINPITKETLQIDKNDPRFLSRELVGVNNGKISVYHKDTGERRQLPATHPDVIDGLFIPKINKLTTLNGETKTLKEWGKKHNLSAEVITSRVDKGWSIEKAISIPVKKIVYPNKDELIALLKIKNFTQIAKDIDVSVSSLTNYSKKLGIVSNSSTYGKIVVYNIHTRERKILPKNHPDIITGVYVVKHLLPK